MASDSNQKPSKKPGLTNNYLKYSGLAVQILATLALAGWGGYALDSKIGWRFPYAFLGLILVAFIGVMVKLYRSINSD